MFSSERGPRTLPLEGACKDFETRKVRSFNTKSKMAATCEPGWLTEAIHETPLMESCALWQLVSPVTGMKNEAVDIDLSHAQRLTIFSSGSEGGSC
jgi:hypothetical protein